MRLWLSVGNAFDLTKIFSAYERLAGSSSRSASSNLILRFDTENQEFFELLFVGNGYGDGWNCSSVYAHSFIHTVGGTLLRMAVENEHGRWLCLRTSASTITKAIRRFDHNSSNESMKHTGHTDYEEIDDDNDDDEGSFVIQLVSASSGNRADMNDDSMEDDDGDAQEENLQAMLQMTGQDANGVNVECLVPVTVLDEAEQKLLPTVDDFNRLLEGDTT